jgi:DNA-binding NtrC family response regulator
MDDNPTITVVMSPADASLEGLTRQLGRLGVTPQSATTVREACALFEASDQPHAVISGVSLSDGNWCDLLAHTVRSESEAKVLVCSATADERLWSEVIWRGGHDVLVEPFDLVHLGRALGLLGTPRTGGADRQVGSLQDRA